MMLFLLLLLLVVVLTSLEIITLEECQALLLSSNHFRSRLPLNSYSSPKNQRRILLHYSTAIAEKATTTNQIIPTNETYEQRNNNDINSNANDNNHHHHRLTTATANTLQEEVGAAFYTKLLELDNFIHLYGHCRVPKRYTPNPSLGNWVNKQRQQYKRYIASCGGAPGSSSNGKTSMNETRIKALNQRGFIWDATTTTTTSHQQTATTLAASTSLSSLDNDTAWQRMYNQLEQYYAFHGHCNVPSSSSLGQWVVRQRFHYRKQQRQHQKQSSSSSLTTAEHRIQLLNALNITWQTYNEQIWEKRIIELQDFASLYGHVCVPRTYTSNPTLGSWVATQRKYYNKYVSQKQHQQQQQHGSSVLGERGLDSSSKKIMTKSKCTLTKERIKQLDKMGFVWSYWDYKFKNKVYE
jgi:hypothetical protein